MSGEWKVWMNGEWKKMQMKEADVSYSGITQSFLEIVVKAATNGQVVHPADDWILQIDIDSEEDWERWEKNSTFLIFPQKEADGSVRMPPLPVEKVSVSQSKSGYPHRHILVTLSKPLEIWVRIALQAVLGSHITREALNAYRVLTNSDCPIVFFENPYGFAEKKFEGRRIVLE